MAVVNAAAPSNVNARAKVDRGRVRHVITENAGVLDTVAALRARDLVAAGRLFVESHASLRDEYAVSIPEVDRLVDIASHGRGATAPA